MLTSPLCLVPPWHSKQYFWKVAGADRVDDGGTRAAGVAGPEPTSSRPPRGRAQRKTRGVSQASRYQACIVLNAAGKTQLLRAGSCSTPLSRGPGFHSWRALPTSEHQPRRAEELAAHFLLIDSPSAWWPLAPRAGDEGLEKAAQPLPRAACDWRKPPGREERETGTIPGTSRPTRSMVRAVTTAASKTSAAGLEPRQGEPDSQRRDRSHPLGEPAWPRRRRQRRPALPGPPRADCTARPRD